MKVKLALAVALALLVVPLPLTQLLPPPKAPRELPWFLDDMRPPDHPPPGFVMPSVRGAPGGIDPETLPDYSTLTVTDEALESHAGSRAVYPLLYNVSLSLSFEWDATVTEFQQMDGGLRRFANFVYDYTDGQFFINKFDIYNNKASWGSVNVHVLNTPMYRANAQYGGLYYGGIIQIGRDAWGESWDSAMGAVILAHEFGHYGLFLPDEYVDATSETLCDNGNANTCIMSNPYSEFEICTDESHNAARTGDPDSCWNYIKHYYSNVVEIHGVPDSGPAAGPGTTVTWHYPDLFANPAEMSVYPATANEGDNLTVLLPVHNLERLIASAVTVKFYVDAATPEHLIQTIALNIGNQESASATFKWQALGGNHSIIGVVDPDGTIKELNEGNNQAWKYVNVNNRPKIGQNLLGFSSREDIPLTVRMTQYGSDVEDTPSSLKWTVLKYNTKAIGTVLHGANQTITFNPVLHWWGTTPVTLSLTDSGNLVATKDINLTFTFFNYAPESADPSFSAGSVLRGKSVELTSAATDVEDREELLTPLFEWKPPGSDTWQPLTATWDGNRFIATVNVPAGVPTGRTDARVAFVDTGLAQGPWTYINASLSILNNRPSVLDLNLSSPSVTRGDLLTLTLNASDLETVEKDLRPVVEYRASEGDWHALPGGEFFQDSWVFNIDVNAGWSIGSYDFRALVNDSDGTRSSWFVDSSALVVSDAFPTLDYVKLSRTRMLRNETATITLVGNDYETAKDNLTVEFKVRDSKGREQNGYITLPEWKGSQWEMKFQPPLGATSGKFTIIVRIGDADGGFSEWYNDLPAVEVGNNQPSAALQGPDFAKAGDLLWFDGSNSSDAENHLSAMSFSWNFGDGSQPGTGTRASHVYGRPGSFRVVLTLTDRDGAVSTAEKTVSIAERPAAPNALSPTGTTSLLLYALIGAVMIGAVGAYMYIRRRKRGPEPPSGERIQNPAGDGGTATLSNPAQPSPGRVEQQPYQDAPVSLAQAPAMPPAAEQQYCSEPGITDQAQYQEPQAMDESITVEPEQYEHSNQNMTGQETADPSISALAEAQPGPYPPPSPMPSPDPDPLRPADPDPGPGPYPEPEPDDDED